MNTLINFLKQVFSILVLKPFDWILFGGAGVLTRSKEEWRADYEAMRVVRDTTVSVEADFPEIEHTPIVCVNGWGEPQWMLNGPELPQEVTTDDFHSREGR
ncbi:MAG: hypothetical protein COW70_10855 [Hydrogenophilales bacterium CG18_big_fil_WC_8_21_14_2_50_58_12]|nr:MAG: hypothetical protein COW70_10855 [Hydrogenophilales bacterium CG18_big_fil_WC_8_21_14_2_50_58_12]